MNLSLMKTGMTVTALAGLLACGGDSTGLSNDPAVGSYFASQFVTTGSFGQINQLVEGSWANITLLGDGTTTGHLHLVATAANPASDVDLAGTWRRTGNTVNFSQNADTFIESLDFNAVMTNTGMTLVADQVFAGVRVQITLSEGGQL